MLAEIHQKLARFREHVRLYEWVRLDSQCLSLSALLTSANSALPFFSANWCSHVCAGIHLLLKWLRDPDSMIVVCA